MIQDKLDLSRTHLKSCPMHHNWLTGVLRFVMILLFFNLCYPCLISSKVIWRSTLLSQSGCSAVLFAGALAQYKAAHISAPHHT